MKSQDLPKLDSCVVKRMWDCSVVGSYLQCPTAIPTSKNPCYAQATWDWICLQKTKQNRKAKQNKNKQTNKKLRIKGPTWTFPTTSKRFQIKITDKQTA